MICQTIAAVFAEKGKAKDLRKFMPKWEPVDVGGGDDGGDGP